MKSNLRVAAVAVFLSIGVSGYAQIFIRPEMGYSLPSTKVSFAVVNGDKTLGGALGFGIAGGDTFGAKNEHEVGLELGVVNFKAAKTTPDTGTDEIRLKTIPILLNYRYYLSVKAVSARFYINPSVGFTHLKYVENCPGFPLPNNGTTSKYGFTAALSLGAAVKLAESTDFDIGYRFLSAKAWEANLDTHNLYAGIHFKF